MGGGHGGRDAVASLGSARPAEADVHAGVRRRLVGVVVVGQEPLSELTLLAVDRLENHRNIQSDMTPWAVIYAPPQPTECRDVV